MSVFAQSLFELLLGWVKGSTRWGYQLFQDVQWQSGFHWLLSHWMIVVLLIMLLGVCIDFIVWMLRWKPHWVWASKIRKLFRKSTPSSFEEKSFNEGYQEPFFQEQRQGETTAIQQPTQYQNATQYPNQKWEQQPNPIAWQPTITQRPIESPQNRSVPANGYYEQAPRQYQAEQPQPSNRRQVRRNETTYTEQNASQQVMNRLVGEEKHFYSPVHPRNYQQQETHYEED